MKNRKILITLIMLFIFIPFVYAASTISKISNIDNVPTISGKKSIYIINADSYNINIKDTTNFKIVNDTDIVVYKKPTKDTTYNNPFSITWQNAGYYVDDNGNTKMVNVVIDATKVIFDTPTESYSDAANHYYVSHVTKSGFSLEVYSMNAQNEIITISPYVGCHIYISFTIVNADGSALASNIANNMIVPWKIFDLDIRDKSVVEIIVNPKTGTRNYIILAVEGLVASIAIFMLIIRKKIFK